MNGREIKRVDAALITYSLHRYNATEQRCACGVRFPATLQGVYDHKRHRMEETLKAADLESKPFCDSCGGPYEELKESGRHWDTCPNRTPS